MLYSTRTLVRLSTVLSTRGFYQRKFATLRKEDIFVRFEASLLLFGPTKMFSKASQVTVTFFSPDKARARPSRDGRHLE